MHVMNICAYCGEFASTRDHVVPRSWTGSAKPRWNQSEWVWACSECNSLLGSSIFDTFVDRREFIREKLRLKYKKLLATPDWTEAELSELHGRLRKTVQANLNAINVIRGRL